MSGWAEDASRVRADVVGAVTCRVPPRHCDAQAMMHASRPLEYFEDAFLTWLDAACAGYLGLQAAGADLVLAESTIRYRRPVRLGDLVTTTATPVERGRTSLRFRFDLTRQGEVLVTGVITYVCVGPSGPMEIPTILEPALKGCEHLPGRERRAGDEVIRKTRSTRAHKRP